MSIRFQRKHRKLPSKIPRLGQMVRVRVDTTLGDKRFAVREGKVELHLKESDILRTVRDFLRWHGWFVVRLQQGLGCHRGLADLVAMRGGRTIWVEVKTPAGRLSEDQEKFWASVQMAGGEYRVVRSLDDVKDLA